MPNKPEIMRFVRSTFRSVWSIELLCFLRKHPERRWSPSELVAALRASDLIVSQSLAALTAAGLVVIGEDKMAQYRPASDALDRLASAAEAEYARSPDAVRRIIVDSNSTGLTAFANAFRLRGD